MSRKVPSVEEYAKKINTAWKKTVDDLLETARLCAEAQKKLKLKERTALKEQLPFGDEAFSMYVKIGSDSWFYKDAIKVKLPASYSSMYELARWPRELREAAVEKGVLHPGATRAKLEQFKEEQTESGSASPAKEKSRQSPAAVKGASQTKSQVPSQPEDQDAALRQDEPGVEGQEQVDEPEETWEQFGQHEGSSNAVDQARETLRNTISEASRHLGGVETRIDHLRQLVGHYPEFKKNNYLQVFCDRLDSSGGRSRCLNLP